VTTKKPLAKPLAKPGLKPVAKKDDKTTTPAKKTPVKLKKKVEEDDKKEETEDMDEDKPKSDEEDGEDGDKSKNEDDEDKPKKAAKSLSGVAAKKKELKKDDKKPTKKESKQDDKTVAKPKKPAAKKEKKDDKKDDAKSEGEDGEAAKDDKVDKKKPKTPRKKSGDDPDKTPKKKTPKKTDEDKPKKDKLAKSLKKKDNSKKKSKDGGDEFEPDMDDNDSEDEVGDLIPFISRKSSRKSSASATSALKSFDEDVSSDIDIKRAQEDKTKAKIAATSLDQADLDVLIGIIESFGDRKYSSKMSSRVEVVVVGSPKRTFKVLSAIARGLWVVKKEWVYECLDKQKWVPYDKYEAVEFWPTVKTARLARESKKKPLLHEKKFYIFNPKDALLEQIEELIEDAGGELVQTYADCEICISNELLKPEVKGDSNQPVVTQTWLFEAIQTYDLPDFSPFVPKSD